MLELIIIIIIIAIVKKVKSDKSFSHHTPPVFRNVQLPKPELSQKEVSRQVNKQIYGTMIGWPFTIVCFSLTDIKTWKKSLTNSVSANTRFFERLKS